MSTSASTPLQTFVDLSALLTGISKDKLAPTLDVQNLKQFYFDFARARTGPALDRLLSIFSANAGQPPAAVANVIFAESGTDICFLARSIMLMWYLGSWYDPASLEASNVGSPPGSVPPSNVVISSQAYTNGWAWNVGQAHPMGYSVFQFGYWAANPPSLQDFVGGESQ